MARASKRPASTLEPAHIQTAAFVIEEDLLRHNLSILKFVKDRTGCKMYQALKTWATWPLFDITKEYLDGTEVSSLNEARLGHDYFNDDVHMYAPAYKDEEFSDILKYCSTIIFNSFAQWKKFKPKVLAYEKRTKTKKVCGLRINPEYLGDEDHGGLWTPGAPGSRLGIRLSEFESALLDDSGALNGISGLHFHIFCDKQLKDLESALPLIEKKFGKYFKNMQWINFGGGQQITDDGYDVEGLISLINDFQEQHGVAVHMEPGAAIVRYAGSLVASVLDIVYRDDVPYKIAILDMSFNAHTPDFLLSSSLDMYVRGADIIRDEKAFPSDSPVYQFSGGTCVTGDKLGHFHSFKSPLKVGDKIIMDDAIQYNLVQCTMFNGVQHPSIVLWSKRKPKVLRKFSYADYRARMG